MEQPKQSLTERQSLCLRLVARGMSSKEIAGEIGLSPQTVDTYIKTAMAKLGASNRRDAARMLVSAEVPQESGSRSAVVAQSIGRGHPGAAAGRRFGMLNLVPPLGGAINELDAASRTLAMLRVAALSAVTMIALVLFVAGAFRALR